MTASASGVLGSSLLVVIVSRYRLYHSYQSMSTSRDGLTASLRRAGTIYERERRATPHPGRGRRSPGRDQDSARPPAGGLRGRHRPRRGGGPSPRRGPSASPGGARPAP